MALSHTSRFCSSSHQNAVGTCAQSVAWSLPGWVRSKDAVCGILHQAFYLQPQVFVPQVSSLLTSSLKHFTSSLKPLYLKSQAFSPQVSSLFSSSLKPSSLNSQAFYFKSQAFLAELYYLSLYITLFYLHVFNYCCIRLSILLYNKASSPATTRPAKPAMPARPARPAQPGHPSQASQQSTLAYFSCVVVQCRDTLSR